MRERPRTVTRLFISPVKSFGLVEVPQLRIGPAGPEGDRMFMVVTDDGQKRKFLSQRTFPRMALVHQELCALEPALELRAPGMGEDPFFLEYGDEGEAITAELHGDLVTGIDQGSEVAQWISTFLKTPCRLIKLSDQYPRSMPRNLGRTGFADKFSLTIGSEESLIVHNARLLGEDEGTVTVERFRLNVVFSGCRSAFEEDSYGDCRIGETSIKAVKLCARCVMINIDPETAEVEPANLSTMASYRMRTIWGKPGIAFGKNCIHLTQDTWIKVGDEVEVITHNSGCEPPEQVVA